MQSVGSDHLFVALARPLMFAGVPYPLLIANVIVVAELFLVSRSLLAVAAGVVLHLAGWLVCWRDPRFIDVWLTKVRQCPRVPNHRLWRCNSYRP